jgi:hypothetical protein
VFRAALVFDGNGVLSVDTQNTEQYNFGVPRDIPQALCEPLGIGEARCGPMEIYYTLVMCRLVRLCLDSGEQLRFQHRKVFGFAHPHNNREIWNSGHRWNHLRYVSQVITWLLIATVRLFVEAEKALDQQ